MTVRSENVTSCTLKQLIDEFSVTLQGVADNLEKQLHEARAENAKLVEEIMTEVAQPKPLMQSIAEPLALPTAALEPPKSDASANIDCVQIVRSEVQKLGINPHLQSAASAENLSQTRPSNEFHDPEAMKDLVRNSVLLPRFDVTEHFHTSGLCQRIARAPNFELFSLLVVSVNSIWICVDLDINGNKPMDQKAAFFNVVEYTFFAYFCVDILIRFLAVKNKLKCLKDTWFLFDSWLVLLMVLDNAVSRIFEDLKFNTSVLRIARLLKLARMARIAKILRRFPELLVLIRGVGVAVRSVISTMVLMAWLVYLFAVTFRFLLLDSDAGDKYFPSVIVGMKWLLLTAAMPDSIDFIEDLGQESFVFGMLAAVFLIVAAMTLLNMMLGVVVETMSGVSIAEREGVKAQIVKEHLVRVLRDAGCADVHDKMLITKKSFQKLMINPSFVKGMRDVNVDPIALVDFIDYIFKDVDPSAQGLGFIKLVEMTIKLGGTNVATVKDVIDMRQVVVRHLDCIYEALGKLQGDVGKPMKLSNHHACLQNDVDVTSPLLSFSDHTCAKAQFKFRL